MLNMSRECMLFLKSVKVLPLASKELHFYFSFFRKRSLDYCGVISYLYSQSSPIVQLAFPQSFFSK